MSIQAILPGEPIGAASAVSRVNRLIGSLPEEDYRRISPYLRHVSLRRGQLLVRQGQPIHEITFPVDGVCSFVKTTEDGHSIEITGVGAEGAVGAGVALGHVESAADAVVQMPDAAALVLPVEVLKVELQRREALASLMMGYCRDFITHVMTAAACNALHTAEQRCCRWLLTTQARLGADNFSVTQEMLAMALGVRRPTVTLIMAGLASEGIVRYARGAMTIVDRTALLSRGCECHKILAPESSD